MRTAVILAAGLGTRFGKYTEEIPKGFIEFKNKPMVIRSIETLLECGIERIIIGTGWKKEAYERLMLKYPQIECVFSPRFSETNSMYTLYCCREAIGSDDFLLLESDIVFEKQAISSLIECPSESAMLITPITKFQDQYYVRMNEKGQLEDCSTDKSKIDPSGELVGIHKLSNKFYQQVVSEFETIMSDKPKIGYEFLLLNTSKKGLAGELEPSAVMNVLLLDGIEWYEIDDVADLEYAEEHLKLE